MTMILQLHQGPYLGAAASPEKAWKGLTGGVRQGPVQRKAVSDHTQAAAIKRGTDNEKEGLDFMMRPNFVSL